MDTDAIKLLEFAVYMCYNTVYLTQKALKYAQYYGEEAEAERLKEVLRSFRKQIGAQYQVSGFTFPKILAITDDLPNDFQLIQWGFVPSYRKDIQHPKDLKFNTLNARAETLFSSATYRKSARDRRCLVILDGFIEPHHYKSLSFPFLIKHWNDDPITLAGIWDDNGQFKSLSIVTVEASPLLSKIHNARKRMPLILPRDLHSEWLKPMDRELAKDALEYILRPYDDHLLKTYSIPPLRSNKKAQWIETGNIPEAMDEYRYPEMEEEYYQKLIEVE